ncbi:MAG: 3'(2'),5'-bisphosphate nucleotidase CysQ [Candidatus Woesearchaeota archaeon]
MDLKEELVLAKKLAREAGTAIMKFYEGSVETSYKEDESPLTQADIASNDIITKGLRAARPEDGVLSEEETDEQERLRKERVWVVDPLDGTKEFLKANGEFTVNIALTVSGEPVLGVVCLPAKDELYWAAKGIGVYKEHDGGRESLAASQRTRFDEMVVVKSRSHASPELQAILDRAGFPEARPAGSSLKGCLVAAGEADVYIRLGDTMEWDICAMDAIIRESGGVLTSLDGKPLKYNKSHPLIRGFVASNGCAHEKLVGLVSHG